MVTETKNVVEGIEGMKDLLEKLVANTHPLGDIKKQLADAADSGGSPGGTSVTVVASTPPPQTHTPSIGAMKQQPVYL